MFPDSPKSAFSLPRETSRLMRELNRAEGQLQLWIASSGRNAQLFRTDPMAAMRAAGLEIEDDLMCELEAIMQGIAQKLG